MSYFVIARSTKTARGLARSNVRIDDALFGVAAVAGLLAAMLAVIAGITWIDTMFVCRSRAAVKETAKAILAFEDEVVCEKLGMNNPKWTSSKHGKRFYCQKNGVYVGVERNH
ncbi:hypothetical protein A2318_02970 [Candidatus Uhrbacteria bacterium RIFOXYB2_FULL_45_11]|uniref:Uncharacterized protein n=1 Tax=Candidatus Uhrbacteria bacterium RIFOXYB2_FULL_45_11 TaxID=1802421 RepID=A0A1F7W466_9BACT|nr:MAG: hypothetical protein A2318_02970 [Candidatus Uhrbacteria bacterium RIFOXYB2_FULL_45_11]